MNSREARIIEIFPKLRDSFQITSPPTSQYNCIAWAAGRDDRCWIPDAEEVCYWPSNIDRRDTIDGWVQAFEGAGYAPCASPGLEQGYQKVAIFADDDGIPRHAARQLPNGRWTSKLGTMEDIEHELVDLEGGRYGRVVRILKRVVQRGFGAA